MIWADYEFYEHTFGGNKIPEAEFEKIAALAEALLQSLIHAEESLELDENKSGFLFCEICERLYDIRSRDGILREKIDDYDVSFDKAEKQNELLCLIRQHLGDQGVLYRGRRR